MAEPEHGATGDGAPARDERGPAARARGAPAPQPHEPARGVGAPHHRGPAADRADPGGDLLRGDVGLTTTTSRCWRPASVEALQDYARNLSERIIPRGVETDEVLGIVLLLRDVLARSLFEKLPGRLRPAQPRARLLRAGGQPDRQHGGDQLRAGARARHPPAAGGDPGALHAGAPGPRTAADPADHRRARLPAGAPAHGAALARDPAPTGPRWS